MASTTITLNSASTRWGYTDGTTKTTAGDLICGSDGEMVTRIFLDFDISGIPTNATVSAAQLSYQVATTTALTVLCRDMGTTRYTAAADTIYSALGGDTDFAADEAWTSTGEKGTVFNATGLSALQEKVTGGDGFYSCGFRLGDEVTGDTGSLARASNMVLFVTYTLPLRVGARWLGGYTDYEGGYNK